MEETKMTLQEKIVQIRKAIPALVKRSYSEEVSYDFVKIDDIFKYLTPALNQHKVNYEIVSETATKKDEFGNPRYLEYLGKCNIWLYEADLEILWINAEQPDDTFQVRLHAIGTHEMPDKAKGSAWTYCLKYYFLDKFGVDQGGDDPDMRVGTVSNEEFDMEHPAAAEFFGDDWVHVDQNYPNVVFADESVDVFANNFDSYPPSREICPENGEQVTLPESALTDAQAEPVSTEGMTVEEACNTVCNFGLHNGKRLGELARGGDVETLKWFAEVYRGPNRYIREAARTLLDKAMSA